MLYAIPILLAVLVILLFTVLVSPPTRWLEQWDKGRQPDSEAPSPAPEDPGKTPN